MILLKYLKGKNNQKQYEIKKLKFYYKQFLGKSIIRIRVPSNHGNISWFKTSDGSLKVYTRRNGEKKQLTPHEIDDRKEKYPKKIIK